MKKMNGRAMTIPSGIAYGVMLDVALTVIFCMVLTGAIYKGKMPLQYSGYAVMIMLFTVSLLGAVVSSQKVKRRTLLVCTLSGIAYLGVLAALTSIFYQCSYDAVGETIAVILGGTMMGTALAMGMKRVRSRR